VVPVLEGGEVEVAIVRLISLIFLVVVVDVAISQNDEDKLLSLSLSRWMTAPLLVADHHSAYSGSKGAMSAD
jgi:hypothetical protein